MNRRLVTLGFAVAITLTSVLMAAIAALDRGGSTVDQILLVALSISVTLLVHFLPSLTRKKFVLIVWGICLFAALFNHLNFFVHSAERADALRATNAEDSIKVRALGERIADVSREYSSISSRSKTDISRDFVSATGWKVRSALKIELAEAKRKTVLSNQLSTLKTELANVRETAGNDAVTTEISRVSGASRVTVNVSIGLLLAMLVELSGAILWYEILHGTPAKRISDSASGAEAISHVKAFEPILVNAKIKTNPNVELSEKNNPATPQAVADKDVSSIILAINNGKCRPTAASIRELLSCRTSRAAELNRMVKVVMRAQSAVVSF